jgi:hypothetical protein
MAKPTVEAGWTPGRDVPQSIAQPTSNGVLILSHFVTMSKTIEAQTLHLAWEDRLPAWELLLWDMAIELLLLCIYGGRRLATASRGALGGDVARLATRPALGLLMARSDSVTWSETVEATTSHLL